MVKMNGEDEIGDLHTGINDVVVRVSLIIKGCDRVEAATTARRRLEPLLQEWFQEDLNGGTAPYPVGSLLVWNIQAKE